MARHALIALWLVGATIAALAQSPAKPSSGPLVDDKRLVMQIDQVAPGGTTNVFGDPSKPGPYVQRVQLAVNAKTRPRFYDRDRWVTVLKGTWWVGDGEVFNPSKLVPIREGGFMFQPANLRTFDFAADGEVILQISGTGPVRATHAEVDANGVAVPVGGPYPEDAAGEGRGRGRGGRRGMPTPM
jgi:hypothetical protein